MPGSKTKSSFLSARPLAECVRACMCVCVRARAIVLGVEWKISTAFVIPLSLSLSLLLCFTGQRREAAAGGAAWPFGAWHVRLFLTFALLCDCRKINFATLTAADVRNSSRRGEN